MHALHARGVRVVRPRDGIALVGGLGWGDHGGAVGGAVLFGVGGGGVRGRRGGGVDDGGDAPWWGGALDELDDLYGVGLAEVEVAGVGLERIAVEHVPDGGGGGGGVEHDRGHLGRQSERAKFIEATATRETKLSKAPPCQREIQR